MTTNGLFFMRTDCQGKDVAFLNNGRAMRIQFTYTAARMGSAPTLTATLMCDRCLDDMEQPVESTDRLKLKLGEEYAEIDDLVIVPEEEGYINVAWFIYEFIALSIPMKHVHAPGKCNKDMVSKLSKHLRVSGDEEEDDFEGSDELEEQPQPIDPRWNELKKILDNN